MEVRLYVGNLDYATTESELRQLFSQSGAVASVSLVKDRDSGRPKGFAFVTMATADGAQKAAAKFHGYELAGRRLTVNMAEKPKANAKAKAPAGYQSKLGAFNATDRSPKVNTLTPGKPGGGYVSKLGAFGKDGGGPTQPRRRGGSQRH